MIALLFAAGIPVLVIAIGNALQSRDIALREGMQRLLSAREVATTQVAGALENLDIVMRTLARTQPVLGLDGDGCAEILRRVLDMQPGRYGNLWVIDVGGTRRCSGLPGEVQIPPPESLQWQRPLVAGELAVGFFLTGGATGPTLLPFAVPLDATQLPRRSLGGTLIVESLAPAASRQAGGVQAWLTDRRSTIISLGGTLPARRPDPRSLGKAIRGEGVVQGQAVNGEDMAYAASALGSELHLVVGMPYAPVREAAWAVLLQRLAELAAFLVVCLAAIIIGADLAMVRPLRSLAERVQRWRSGVVFERPPSTTEPREVIELEKAFDQVVRALEAREGELRTALDHSDALMAEIHHRVKNNLQVVSSLLNLQGNRIADPAAQNEFRAARNRVRALATLHRHLYLQQSFESITLRPFLDELAAQQFSSQGEAPGERLALRIEAEDLVISTDQAVSIALLLTETVGNAVAHAFPDDRTGTVTVAMRREGAEAILTVTDDGIGLPVATPPTSLGLGLQLLDGFARQLGGRLARGPGPGTSWIVRFPLRERAEARHPGASPRATKIA
ncbi:sensor histidine kinase [Roseomonas cutis]|uniref:sensor histidine kinase n=1 Tax=Roseomonas cutis TaxID=2897332 RepID=UPI00272D46DC|nr:sensor histidine kinase [Roseomonas sp. OT10]